MKTSEQGIELIKGYEGFRENAYKCPAGVLTIGYGHIKDVFPGMHTTEQSAVELLKSDLITAESAVKRLVKVPLKQNQFDALVSFTFNLGEGNLKSSTLLKVINSTPNDFEQIAYQFSRWNKAGGKILEGLVKRRKEEATLYCL